MLYLLKPPKTLTGRYIINEVFLQIVPYTGTKIVYFYKKSVKIARFSQRAT